MSKLYVEVFLDDNVDVLVAKIVRARGFRATTTDETGRKGTSDAEQLKYCDENGLAILTMDRIDFEALAKQYFYSGWNHNGIIIVADNSPQIIAQRLGDFLDFNTADEIVNQVVYI